MQEILMIYGIFDKKSLTYDTPFFAVSDLFAERRFRLMCNEKPSVLNTWTEEFALVRLGKVNIITGAVEADFEDILDGKGIIFENGKAQPVDEAELQRQREISQIVKRKKE
jgi:hypothetical protein